MPSLVLEVFNVVAPVFACIGVGFAWVRAGRPFDRALIASLVMTIGTPALILSSYINHKPDLGAVANIFLAAALCFAGFALVGYVVLRALKMDLRVLSVVLFPNTGNMGIPICFLAFGEEGLTLAIAFFTITATVQFTLGAFIASGHASFKALLRLPMIYAVGLALGLTWLDLTPPEWISHTLTLFGGLTIPLMLLALGAALGGLKLKDMGALSPFVICRVVGGPLIGWGVASLLGLEGTAAAVVILQAAMPTAVYVYLFAEQFSDTGQRAASAVFLATLLSLVTLPTLLVILL